MGGYDPPPTLHAFDFLATPFYVDVACAVILLIQVGILLVVVRARRQPWHGAALWRLLFALLALALALHQSDFYRRSCGGLSLTPTVLPAFDCTNGGSYGSNPVPGSYPAFGFAVVTLFGLLGLLGYFTLGKPWLK